MADAGTATVTNTRYMVDQGKGIDRVTVEWITTAGGAFENTFTPTFVSSVGHAAKLLQVATIPDSGGTQPDDLYDVVVNDADGVDVLQGQGANRSDTNAQGTTFLGPTIVTGALTIIVTNAGASKGGTVRLFFG